MRPFRMDKLASTLREIISEAIANKLNDPRISPITSVTRVELSGDLQLARIYVSVLGPESQARKTMAGLTNAVGHVQRLVAAQLNVRRCPEISFVLDESLKKAAHISRVIDEAVRQDGFADEPDLPAEGADGGPATDGVPER